MKEECLLPIVIDGVFLLERGTGFVVFGSSGHQAAPEPSIVFMEALWPVSPCRGHLWQVMHTWDGLCTATLGSGLEAGTSDLRGLQVSVRHKAYMVIVIDIPKGMKLMGGN